MATLQKQLYEKKYSSPLPSNADFPVSRQMKVFIRWLCREYDPDRRIRILDLGGGVCQLGRSLQAMGRPVDCGYQNFEMSPVAVERSKGLGFTNTVCGEIPETGRLPFDDASFDVIHCSHVIEHLLNPDIVFEEGRRLLVPGGMLVVATPNMASWLGRFLVACGWQGYGQEISTRYAVAGKGPLARIIYGVGGIGYHLRVFTMAGLKDMMRLHGYRLERSCGVQMFEKPTSRTVAGVLQGGAWLMDSVFSLAPSLACNIMCFGRSSGPIKPRAR